jgi:hypothetical protein
MHQTRFIVEKKRSHWRETKRQQRKNPTVLESHRNSSREYQRRRLQMLQNLQENNSKLEDKIEKLEKIIESQNEQIAALILQNLRLVSQNEKFTQIYSSLYNQPQTSSTHCEAVVNECLKNGYLLQRIIRFNWQQFKELLQIIQPNFANLTTRGTPRIRTVERKKEMVSMQSHLFITLFWLRNYPTDIIMKMIFHVDERKITRILRRTLTSIYESLGNLISWPTDAEFEEMKSKWNEHLPKHLKDLVCVVDGTEIRIPRPSQPIEERSTYSVKKKQHSFTLILICLLDGRLIFGSDPMIGANDQSHWNALQLREKFVNKNYGVIGDGGFTFNHKDGEKRFGEIPILNAVPHRKPRKGKLNENQKLENRVTSQYRVVIENLNRRLKGWRIFSETCRHFSLIDNNQIDIQLLTKAILLLTAFYNKYHPIRKEGWKPGSAKTTERHTSESSTSEE